MSVMTTLDLPNCLRQRWEPTIHVIIISQMEGGKKGDWERKEVEKKRQW